MLKLEVNLIYLLSISLYSTWSRDTEGSRKKTEDWQLIMFNQQALIFRIEVLGFLRGKRDK